MKKLVTTIAALTISLGMLSGNAQAGHKQTIDELAYLLKRQAAQATREVRYGFRHSPQYRHLYSDMYDLYVAAGHLYGVARQGGNSAHILEDVRKMDESLHHAEELVVEMKAARSAHHGYGHHSTISSYHLRRLCDVLEEISHSLHRLQEIVDYRSPVRGGLAAPPAVAPPLAVPVTRVRRRGIEVFRSRRGGFGISLRIR